MTTAEATFRLKNEGKVTIPNNDVTFLISYLFYHNEEIEIIVKKNKYTTTFKLIK